MNFLAGFKTFIFAALLAVIPALLVFLGGYDWTKLGISPTDAAVIAAIVTALRGITNTPPLNKT